MAEKSNIQHLRDILKEILTVSVNKSEIIINKVAEANEFIDALEEREKERIDELNQTNDRCSYLEKKLWDVRNPGKGWSGRIELGLDTMSISLSKGNLRIQSEIESFVKELQKRYVGVSAYPLF